MLNEDFFKQFPDEQSCKIHLKEQREKQGITCKKCNSKTKHFWLTNVEKWQCYECNSRTNLTAGTMMHRSKLPLHTWYKCIHYMTSTKAITLSALQMSRHLNLTTYSAVWLMMQKIRVAMGRRDDNYKLKGDLEIDDAYFEAVMYHNERDEMGNIIKVDKNGELYRFTPKNKRGRGTRNKRAVLVMVESKPTKNTNPNKKNRQMGFVKMVAMDNLQRKNVEREVVKAVDQESHIITDGHRCYKVLNKIVEKHSPEVVKPKQAMKKLPWVHTTIANSKRRFLGVYHSVNDKYLQNYLNEFTYKLNRSDFARDSFDGLFNVALSGVWNQ